MRLQFHAFEKTGKEIRDVIEAPSLAEASDALHKRGLFIAEILPVGQAAPAAPTKRKFRVGFPRSKVRRLRELSMFTRQLYALVRSGTPLTNGLGALEQQAVNPGWKAVIGDLRARLERGSSLSDALAMHPEYFDKVYQSMVAAGESSGQLPVLLDRLATLCRKRAHVLGTIQGAMAYPILLASIAMIVMVVLLVFVVPRFADLFKNLGAPIPPTTAILVLASDILKGYWWLFVPAFLGVIVGLVYCFKTPAARRIMDGVVLKLPRIGRTVKCFAVARITRLLGLLTESFLPVQEILRLTREATTNHLYADLLGRAEEMVNRGQPISSAFHNSPLINPTVYETLRSGEQSGQVGPLLLELADFLDEENEITLKSLTSIIEPVLLILMGVMVGFVAVSIFLPLFDVTGMMSGGAH